MCSKPQCARGAGWVEAKFLPPLRFIPATVDFAMVSPAQRHREFITDLPTERPVLRKPQMMGVARLTSTDQAGLL
jgi:hypothetical protein